MKLPLKHTTLACALVLSAGVSTALANHPVLVEGEKDYNGNGLVGAAEDSATPTDRVFGTINGALGTANNGIAQNGSIQIVTSGRFPELVQITPTTGNVTIEAAPGVLADIDAVLQGDPGNGFRQGIPGIIINAPATSRITLKNLTIRNWTVGVFIMGNSNVTLENCLIEGNTNQGILVGNNAKVAIVNCTITSSGFRTAAAPVTNPRAPGAGIQFFDNASGIVSNSTITGNFDVGIERVGTGTVTVRNNTLFNNNPDTRGALTTATP